MMHRCSSITTTGGSRPDRSSDRSPLQEGCSSSVEAIDLLVVLISVVVNDVEELELVDSLGGGDNTEPVTELHLLEELLGAERQT